jgi:hypothetical protein
VIVGVTSDLAAGKDLARLRVVLSIDGAVVSDHMHSLGSAAEPLAFPAEEAFRDLRPGARVEATLDGFQGTFSDEKPIVRRKAATEILEGRTLLLRARLENECVESALIPGNKNAPDCPADQTCVAAECRDPFQAPHALEDYSSDWATDYADPCKPLDHGKASLAVGLGQDDWAPIEAHQKVPVWPGPQGGYHVWAAVRMKNLHQQGSVTSVSARSKELDAEFERFDYAFGYHPAADGECELAGLRYELPAEYWSTIEQVFDKELTLSVEVLDGTGDTASGELTIRLGP